MFTGIIEELGKVKKLEKTEKSAQIMIQASLVNQDLQIGDSIAVNGVCLTIVAFTPQQITAQVMAETLTRTTLGMLKPGDQVNLERALTLSTRLGGHLVSGHVDGTGKIMRIRQEGIAQVITISYPQELDKYLAIKGSVAIDGISLTLVGARDGELQLSLIPHSLDMTTLGFKKPGDWVNIEIDLLARYLERLLEAKKEEKKEGPINAAFLAENGFL